ncbi:hypothetical protein EV426DRAFT_594775 [Tirmania nivea]|nr:hypothetical protein EV426DRAFT_594775 [Tirmania nivea]
MFLTLLLGISLLPSLVIVYHLPHSLSFFFPPFLPFLLLPSILFLPGPFLRTARPRTRPPLHPMRKLTNCQRLQRRRRR